MSRLSSKRTQGGATGQRRRWPVLAGLLIIIVCAPVVLLSFDQNVLNRAVRSLASARLGRTVRFSHFGHHLLSLAPEVSVTGLTIASPAWAGPRPLFTASAVTARLSWPALLLGRVEPVEMRLRDPALNLVRESPGQNNWSFSNGGGGNLPSALRRLRRLEIRGGRFELDDRPARLTLQGRFSQDERSTESLPLRLEAAGLFDGAPLSLRAQGAAMTSRSSRAGYPFRSDIVDGATRLSLSGASVGFFDISDFDARLQANGPNLTNLGYLFRVFAPNSTPFSLSAQVHRRGSVFSLTDIEGRMGASDVSGEIAANRVGGRRLIQLRLSSATLHAHDLEALFAPRPPHTAARSVAGANSAAAQPSRRLLSDKPFPIKALQGVDMAVQLKVGHMPDLWTPIDDLRLELRLQSGKLTVAPVSFTSASGRVNASIRLQAATRVSDLRVWVEARGLRLGGLGSRVRSTLDGNLDSWVALRGRGSSLHAAATNAIGRAAFRVTDGVFLKSKAAALSGDLIQAANLSLGDKATRTELKCAVGEFDIDRGLMRAQSLTMVTGVGSATARGTISLGAETLALTIQGLPNHRRLLQLNLPIELVGSLSSPAARLQTRAAVKTAGAMGLLALAAGPLAAVLPLVGEAARQPDCAKLEAGAANFVRPTRLQAN